MSNNGIAKKKYLCCLLTVTLVLSLFSMEVRAQGKDIRVHDPVMARHNGTYYLFSTGSGIAVWSSEDMENWKKEKPVFETPPAWAMETVPGFKGHIWAPDIFYHNGKYHLYYSISAFGKNTSAIGLATNETLDPEDPAFQWIDQGKVVQSVPGRDLWNAIDPNVILDEEGQPWLSFGSFWNGLKLVKLNQTLSGPAQPEEWYTIAARARDWQTPDSVAGKAAIEAPFIFKKDDFYYLFVSTDYCCRGEDSTYKIAVGRSKELSGPYLDRQGTPMRFGGGTVLLEGGKDWYGVGHNSVYAFDGTDYLVFHGYDASDKGKPKLRIEKLQWDPQGWPLVSKEQ